MFLEVVVHYLPGFGFVGEMFKGELEGVSIKGELPSDSAVSFSDSIKMGPVS